MKRLAMVCVLSAVAGCTDNYSVIILRNTPSASQCMGDTNEGTASLVNGLFDVSSPLPDGTINPGYYLTPIARSAINAPTVTPTNVGNPHGHIAYIQGAEIEILSDGTEVSNRLVDALRQGGVANRMDRFTIVMEPGSLAAFAFPVLDPVQTQLLDDVIGDGELGTVITRAKLIGRLDSGSFDSLPFDFPVTICRGCLIKHYGSCATYSTETMFEQGGVCGRTQDEVLSCCDDKNGNTVCPAVGEMPPMEP